MSLVKKKRVLVLVNHSNDTELHSDNVRGHFHDNTRGSLRKKMAKRRIAYNRNSSLLSMTSSTKPKNYQLSL